MKTPFLLASDLDGTLIPPEDEPEYRDRIADFAALRRLHTDVRLAFVTGRHQSLAEEAIARFELPLPEYLVCDVGTSVYVRQGSTWALDEEYRTKLRAAWRGMTARDIAARLAGIPGLDSQEAERQREFKQSYYVPPEIDKDELAGRIERRLEPLGIAVNVICSRDAARKVGLVDVIPASAAKDAALSYLWKKTAVPEANVVYAGDSGNDLAPFLSGFKAIVVGNAPDDIKNEVRLKAPRPERVFFATAPYARGVIEGCRHFGVFTRSIG